MAWWKQNKYNNYSDLVALWKTCRSKEKGKPLNTGHRLLLVGDKFTITYNGYPIAHITPDNIVELVSDRLSVALYKTLPIIVMRYATGKYRVDHASRVKTQSYNSNWLDFNEFKSEAHPQYFDGIKFNLLTGECVNRLPDLKHRVIPEVSLQWKRDIGAWQKGWKVRQRMGVTPAYERDILALGHGPSVTSLLNKAHDERLMEVVRFIKAQDFSIDAFIYVRHYGAMYNPSLDIEAGLKVLFGKYRDDLRKIYGGFG